MKIFLFILTTSLILLGRGEGGTIAPGFAQSADPNQDVFFRTRSYVVQVIWRAGKPVMTVSNNGWRVLVDCPATVAPSRGTVDTWTTYTCRSADSTAIVRVGPQGQGSIETVLAGRRVNEQYSMNSPRQRDRSANREAPNETILAFDTGDYAVRVYRQNREMFMNLYNKQSATTELRQVPVALIRTNDSTVYQYHGAYRHHETATIQARENANGIKTLYILQNNEIKYRGEGY